MAEHWHIEYDREESVHFILADRKTAAGQPMGVMVCQLPMLDDVRVAYELDEAAAADRIIRDAWLLAAAPQLIEALQLLDNEFDPRSSTWARICDAIKLATKGPGE